MTVDHRFLSSSEVHEPKHISLATTANSGEVITPSSSNNGQSVLRRLSVSDLSNGSDVVLESALINSDRLNYQGWRMIEDGLISTPTISVGTTPTLLTIDDEDEANNTNSNYLPLAIRGTGDLWSVANSRITPIHVGDSYDLRINLGITAVAGNPTNLTVKLDIGSGSSPTIITAERVHNITKTPPYTVSFTIPVFTLDNFVNNGGRIFLSTDAGTVTVGTRSLLIVRTGSGLNGA